MRHHRRSISSLAPNPQLPTPNSQLPTPNPLLRSLRRLRAAFWWRRVLQWLVRAIWLALLVPTIFMAGYLWGDWSIRWYYWVGPMLLVGLLSILWPMRPIRLKKIAYRLDERLGLRAQLITAFEVSHRPDTSGVEASAVVPASAGGVEASAGVKTSAGGVEASAGENLVVQRLLQETVHLVISLRRRIRIFNRPLWLEMQALIGVSALLSALLMLDALTPQLPNATPVALPPPGQEPGADEVIPPIPQLFPPPFQPEIQVQAFSQEQVQRALQMLADALRDQAITRSVAEAIDRGDLGGAAEGLRRLADQLEGLSEEARAGLGDALQEAADNIGNDAPGLTQSLLAGSEALGRDDLRGAGQALEEMAETLDSIEEAPQETAQVQPEESDEPGELDQAQADESQDAQEQESQDRPGESGNGPGDGNDIDDTTQPTEEERLAIEGQPLELESDPLLVDERVLQPAELEAEAGQARTEDSPFARQSVNGATDLGPDPLTYPWEKREIIRRYFTP